MAYIPLQLPSRRPQNFKYLWLVFWGDLGLFNRVSHCWPREGDPIFASHFATWDAAHYLFLSEEGYQSAFNSRAFYPLWPMATRWSSVFFGGSHLISGIVLANLCSLGAFILFYRIVLEKHGKDIAFWAVLFLVLFPGSLFYQFHYSEPLFFLLVMGLWWGLEKGCDEWVWAAGFLLPLSRPVGVVSVVPIAWHLAMRHPLPGLGWLTRWGRSESEEVQKGDEGGDSQGQWSNLRFYKLLAAPLMGFGAYLTFMWASTGYPLEGIHAQRGWGVHSVSNLVNLPKFVMELVAPVHWHSFRGSLLDRCLFWFMLHTVPILWRLDKGLLAWFYMLAIFPAMSGSYVSFTRYGSTVFPVFLALAWYLHLQKSLWTRGLILILFAILHLVLVWRFVNFRWAG